MDSEETELRFIRLKNGDDVIAEMVELTENNITVYMLVNPLKVVYIPGKGQGVDYLQVAFIPWVFSRICADEEFMVHAEDIITMGNVTPMVEEHYWKNVEYFADKGDKESVEDLDPEEEHELELDLESIIEKVKAGRTYH